MDLSELSTMFRQWADVLDGKVEGVRAESMPDGSTVTCIDLPTQGLTREGVQMMGALAHLALRTHEADPSNTPHTLSIRHVTAAPKPASTSTNGMSNGVAASPKGRCRSGSEAKQHPTGYASALEAVMSSEDLIDHLLPFLDVFMLGTVMQINRQWKRVAMRDAHWEDRIGGFLCNRTFQADAREVMRPTQLWSWYSRMERSWKEFDTRAVLPERPGVYEDVFAWLSVMINDSSETDWDLQPLAGKVVPLGDGRLLSGGVAVAFSEEDSWELECEGSTPLEALRSYFAEEGGRELLVDLWLMDTDKERCALAARDWGRTLVIPASEEEDWEPAQGVELPTRDPASPDDFLIKNDNDTCRVYSNGEVHIVLHSTLTLTRLSSIPPPDSVGPPTDPPPPTEPQPPPAAADAAAAQEGEGDEQGEEEGEGEEVLEVVDPADAPQVQVQVQQGVDLASASGPLQPLHVFRVSRMVLKTCLGLGSADKGVEEVEPEHAEELHRSVLRLAHLLH